MQQQTCAGAPASPTLLATAWSLTFGRGLHWKVVMSHSESLPQGVARQPWRVSEVGGRVGKWLQAVSEACAGQGRTAT